MSAPALPITPELARRLGGGTLVLMLDVDGTLAPIAARPEEAMVPPDTRRVLAALAARPGVHVVLVSGRAARDARRMVAVGNVWAVGNHGFEVLGPDGEELVQEEVAPYRGSVRQAMRRLAPLIQPVDGAILEDKEWTLSVHYRLVNPAVVPRVRRIVSDVATQLGLRMTEGKMVLEVRPPAHVDKGTAVLRMSRQLGGGAPGASVLFAGDDVTDEDAFRALTARGGDAVTIRVTAGESVATAAEYTVEDTEMMRRFLEELLVLRGGAMERRSA